MSKQAFQLSFDNTKDTAADLSTSDIPTKFRTKNFGGTQLMVHKQPRMLAVKGKFERDFTVTPYIWDSSDLDDMTYETLENVMIMGQYVMGGAPTTKQKDFLEEPVPVNAGDRFSFEFDIGKEHFNFELTGYRFTFVEFARNI